MSEPIKNARGDALPLGTSALADRILPLLLSRFPWAEGKIHLSAAFLSNDDAATCQKWQWYVWIDSLPFRLGSFETIDSLAAAQVVFFVNSGDTGGTPGFGDFVTRRPFHKTRCSEHHKATARLRTRQPVCRTRQRSSL